jgi:Spy/CpxP family protein refolding chaperone
MPVAVSMLTLLASLGFWQGTVGGFRWWLDPSVQRELGLTGRQVANIDTEFGRGLDHRRLLRREFDAANAELTRAFASGDLSDAAAKALVSRVEDLRRQRNVARWRVLVAMYFLLTPEQRTRLPGIVASTIIGTPAARRDRR